MPLLRFQVTSQPQAQHCTARHPRVMESRIHSATPPCSHPLPATIKADGARCCRTKTHLC
ncbi:uncharacterized protein SETTUDRAFT_168927 [Exserohilum turcica Et28A]|uniref:Uncharacterized protein n=1 Tax=Exserohilum turcicum (strain 28A) TaxID=671987 RepID=R0ISJ4_EXST2|nr:uncharacterized protein SETTUDRAFT_168927 [Exserohilum turcica Et28A]EOA87815.1 hypothetical protein SETTUDRAFT_168927 [Exserohilum turcica Et28A]